MPTMQHKLIAMTKHVLKIRYKPFGKFASASMTITEINSDMISFGLVWPGFVLFNSNKNNIEVSIMKVLYMIYWIVKH